MLMFDNFSKLCTNYAQWNKKKGPRFLGGPVFIDVGPTGFEPVTPCL